MDEMAKTIGITRRFVKFDHLFRQKIRSETTLKDSEKFWVFP